MGRFPTIGDIPRGGKKSEVHDVILFGTAGVNRNGALESRTWSIIGLMGRGASSWPHGDGRNDGGQNWLRKKRFMLAVIESVLIGNTFEAALGRRKRIV